MMGPLDKYQKYGNNIQLTQYRSISLEILDPSSSSHCDYLASDLAKLHGGASLQSALTCVLQYLFQR